MENNNYNNFNFVSQENTAVMSKTFIANVFSWMFTALLISGATAYLLGHDEGFIRMLISETGLTGFGYFVIFSPLIFSFAINLGINRFSHIVVVLLFLAFSILMGMSLSFIFLVYNLDSIMLTFAISAAAFGIMAIAGYTTSTDLSKMGSILVIGAIAVVAISWINFMIGSDMLDFISSAVGVVVFTGLAAYKVQYLKQLGTEAAVHGGEGRKYAVWGAFGLYISFINLFLSLLRFTGGRK
ncbi:MAG: Bax inhibitor-1/YccA family protein [Bacteroidia bacterium]